MRLLELAVQGLHRRPLRALITLVSIVVGTAGLLLFIAVAFGLQDQLQQQLGTYEPATILHVDPPLSAAVAANSGPPAGLDQALLARLQALPHVREAFPEVQVGGVLSSGTARGPLALRPVPPSYVTGGAAQLLAGTTFTDPGARALLLSVGFAQFLSTGAGGPGRAGAEPATSVPSAPIPGADLVGKAVQFTPEGNGGQPGNPVELRVVGIVDGRAPFAYIPFAAASSIFPLDANGYDAAIVEVDSVQNVAAVRQRIEALQLHVETPDALATSLTNALGIARIVAALVALLGLALATASIISTLLGAVAERAREIGIMKAVGARNWHVGTVFLLESLLLGFSGSVLGSALAALLGQLIPRVLPLSLPDSPALGLSVPAPVVAATILAVTAVSGLAGVLPALRAARLDPATAITLGAR